MLIYIGCADCIAISENTEELLSEYLCIAYSSSRKFGLDLYGLLSIHELTFKVRQNR